MKKLSNNTFLQYAFVACLGIALTLGQAFKLHIHVLPQDNQPISGTTEHFGNIHIASTLHDIAMNDTGTQLKSQTHDHAAEIDISSNGFFKKAELLVLAAIVFLITTLLLFKQYACRIIKRDTNPDRLSTTLLYLLNPPLRAPPARLPI